ncbi:MAG: hypothetical protein A2Y10_20245 [Planctomycetes bacterium GWF2_41_51]|nr:MAG: hypothetical protein A2Y10_20245 [Planctomycetes bacterium GWF2_41_51]HBG25754.1 hypothetical protein [Phycisphaerales bacterium]
MKNLEKTNQSEPPRYISFYRQDLQFIAAKTNTFNDYEHGFSLFGFSTYGGNMVCMLAVSGAPNAIRSSVHFQDDPEFIMKVSRYLFDNYGIQYIGNAHSHHDLNILHPSGDDRLQIHNVAVKNHIKSLAQIILTYEYYLNNPNCQKPMKNGKQLHIGENSTIMKKIIPFYSHKKKVRHIRFNSYIYPDAQIENYQPAKIKLLEGVNPIRQQLRGTELGEFIDVCEKDNLPFERVLIDKYIAESNENVSELPEVLSDKLLTLPEEVLEKSQIESIGSHLKISFVFDRYTFSAMYGTSNDCPFEKIEVISDNQAIDLTKYVRKLINSDNLLDVCRATLKVMQQKFGVYCRNDFEMLNNSKILGDL